MFPHKGTLTLTPGMGVGLGPFGTPQIRLKSRKTKHNKKVCTKIVHTSGTFFKLSKKYLENIFIYTENDNEPDKRI